MYVRYWVQKEKSAMKFVASSVLFTVFVVSSSTMFAADWPCWGGRDDRNTVSDEKNLPDTFDLGQKKATGSGIDLTTTKNVKWSARLGGAAYGNPTVAGGRVFVGTDDKLVDEDARFTRSKAGMLLCFDEKTGDFLWQLVTPRRSAPWPNSLFTHQDLGTCSSPAVDGDRVYIVSTACEVLCLDVRGLAHGNEGPFTDEGKYMAGAGNPPVKTTPRDADIVWKYDLIDEIGVRPHDAASCSVLIHGDVLYVGTSNGMDKGHEKMSNPDAPAFIALDKRTGRLLAKENAKLSARQFHCQWSSPSLGKVGDKTLVFLGGGDGVCYAFEALASIPEKPVDLKVAWSYDCNPPSYKLRDGKPIRYTDGDKRKRTSPNKNDGLYIGPSDIIATPVFNNGRIYVATGQDPAHGRGKGMLSCIDATKTGDITETGKIWSYDGIDRTIADATIADGLVYIPDVAGRMHCLDADTGKVQWVFESGAETWGGVLVADGKIYWANVKEAFVMAVGKEMKILSRVRLPSPAYSTPIVANGTIYLTSQKYLWAIGTTAK